MPPTAQKPDSPLRTASLMAFAATNDAARCRSFYEGKLGLTLVHEDAYGLVFDSAGTRLRIEKGPQITVLPRTIAGWNVRDIDAVVADLEAKSVAMERYSWLKQDAAGIAAFPGGSRVAWFKDPDGNILSLSQTPF